MVKVFSPERFLLVWVVFVYVFFSISDSKLPSYILPMFPALALLMGKQLAEMKARRLFWMTIPSLVAVAILLGIAPFVARTADTPLQQQMYSNYSVWLIIALVIWLVGMGVAMWLMLRENKMVAVIVLAFSRWLPRRLPCPATTPLRPNAPAIFLPDAIRPLVKPDVPFYSVFCYDRPSRPSTSSALSRWWIFRMRWISASRWNR